MQMLIGFMIAGALISLFHQLGVAGKISAYGETNIKPAHSLGALVIFALSISPYASSLMGFALMVMCFVGAWTITKILVDVALRHF